MSWSTPTTWTTGDVITAAKLNVTRDDLNETAPAKFTTKGDILAATAANAGARVGVSGTDGNVLQEDSSQTNGLKFAAAPLPNILRGFAESKTLLWLPGAPVTSTTLADKDKVGLGCIANIATSGTIKPNTTSALYGGWNLTLAASTGSIAAIVFGDYDANLFLASQDCELVLANFIGPNAPSNFQFFFGLGVGLVGAWSDANSRIGFRVVNNGNIVGFVDNAGTETTRDTGTAPNGTTPHDLRIRVSGGGTVVQFFMDGAQVGADVTTNIPSALMQAGFGCQATSTTANTVLAGFAGAWR